MNSDRDNVTRMLRDPVEYFDRSLKSMMTLSQEEIQSLALAGLKLRFEQLKDAIPMVQKLADRQGITEINELNDIVPMLFDHTMYKSYPPSMLYNNRYDQLTKWLNKLTADDLSGFDDSVCHNVDDWLLELDRQTPLKPCHTSGSSGVFSFLPRSKDDWHRLYNFYRLLALQDFESEKFEQEELPLNIHAIFPFFRSGGTGHMVINDVIVEMFCGGEESKFHATYPGRCSSEMMLLSARIQQAKAAGQLDKLKLSPELLEKKDQFLRQQQEMPAQSARFFAEMADKLRGERVFIQAPSPMLFQMAEKGLEFGVEGIFAENSVVISGGGGKGIVLPDDWDQTVSRYLGCPVINIYGMSECLGWFGLCSHGHYHIIPTVVPFIVDPETSQPLPREGVVTGRWAHFDLFPEKMWGGFISGDEVTMHWDGDCGCGRTTAYLEKKIQRYSDKNLGGDKITCAATADSYAEAMDFLNNMSDA